MRRHLSSHKLVYEFSDAFGPFIISSIIIDFMLSIFLIYLMLIVGFENPAEFWMWTGNTCQVMTR